MRTERTYLDALDFWNQAFVLDEDAKKQYTQEFDSGNGWKKLAPADKLRDLVTETLSDRKQVLDYGCGDGWAGIALCKCGCGNVTSVDVSENAIACARFLAELYHAGKGFRAECVSTGWIGETASNRFDGFYCSNVIDVVPPEVADGILENISRITTRDAKIILSMNHYKQPAADPGKNVTVRNGNEIFIDGILRLVSRTDEEWSEILNRYFDVLGISYFAWPGEKEERRRIFELRNKNKEQNGY